MKLSLLCCFLLLVVPPVFPFPAKNETVPFSSVSELTDLTDGEVDQPTGEQVAETNDEEIVTQPSSEKNKNDRKRPNKQRIRNRYNKQNDKRHKSSKKHSPTNNKKGANKKPMKSQAIQYEPRSPYTDQLNSVVDDMIVHLSQAMLNDSYATFKLRMAIIPSTLQAQQWAYVSGQLAEENGTEQDAPRLKRDAINDEEELQSLAHNDEEDDLHQEHPFTSITENKGAITENVDHDEEDEDETADDSTKVTTGGRPQFQLTKKPSPMSQSDGSKLYKLQLVPEEKTMKNETGSSEGHHGRRPGSRKKNNKHRQQQYRYPRRPNAVVEGLELIRRDGDVMVGSKANSSVRIFDVRIQMGPIKFVLKQSTDVPVSKSNVTSPLLFARLRIMELDGKLDMSCFKPTKISPNESVVTISVAKGQNLPSDSQIATTVTHLSQELSRSWNTGYLLRRVKRKFKQLYVTKTWNKNNRKAQRVHNEEAKKLTQVFLKSSQSMVPSTPAPLIVH